jgi:hypothetical protein
MQEHTYEQKQKEESREGSARSAKCKSAKLRENPVAPDLQTRWHRVSQDQQRVEKNLSQIFQDKLLLIQNKRRLSKYSL